MKRRTNRALRPGTSMVELLVVIVIFLIGILAVVQIFPRGFQIISVTKNKTVLDALARAEMERVRGRPDQLPEQILPTGYLFSAGVVVITADPNNNPNNLGPYTNRIDQNGNILDGVGNVLGNWGYLSGGNNVRRIIGEGGPVPAPRRVGALVGGLMVLQFAPIVFNPSYQSLFQVYGPDMVRRFGDPPPSVRRDYEYFVNLDDTNSAEIWLPANPAKARSFRLAMTAWINNGTRTFRREVIDATVPVPAGIGYYQVPLAGYAGLQVGETFVGVEYDSVRAARNFDRVLAYSSDPYEFQMLDETLGLILFNPRGYNYVERRANGRRIPLTARVNYDVYDWRIVRDEFRIADSSPVEQRLKLGNLRVKPSNGPDGKLWQGLNVTVSDEAGGTENREFLILDLDTGGIFSKTAFTLDGSIGLVTFLDSDANPANGVQGGIILPGQNAPTQMTISGRNVRCLYMGVGEWTVQVSKAASTYRGTSGNPGVAEYYAGGAGMFYNGAPLAPGESLTRIYFAPMEVGKRVTIGEVWYDAGGPEPQCLQNQDFLITNSPIDPNVGLPYIDIREHAPTATAINFTRYNYGVRGVRGASVSVRALWNPASFTLSNDEAANLEEFEKWGRNWRRSQTDSFLTKEGVQ